MLPPFDINFLIFSIDSNEKTFGSCKIRTSVSSKNILSISGLTFNSISNKSIEESYRLLDDIYSIANKGNKEVVLYLSMAFGNPYGDDWNAELVHYWVDQLCQRFGPSIISMSDTIGCADKETIAVLFRELINSFTSVEFGAHLHVKPEDARMLIDAAYKAGCRRFDTAMRGFGGCPMAKDDLTGNMPTEELLIWMHENNIINAIDNRSFDMAIDSVEGVFKEQ